MKKDRQAELLRVRFGSLSVVAFTAVFNGYLTALAGLRAATLLAARGFAVMLFDNAGSGAGG